VAEAVPEALGTPPGATATSDATSRVSAPVMAIQPMKYSPVPTSTAIVAEVSRSMVSLGSPAARPISSPETNEIAVNTALIPSSGFQCSPRVENARPMIEPGVRGARGRALPPWPSGFGGGGGGGMAAIAVHLFVRRAPRGAPFVMRICPEITWGSSLVPHGADRR
jgi:hypothetical protein